MKIQSLAILFVLIILPITITLTEYVQAYIDTATLEAKYDAALDTATYDALKALQINTSNNAYSDIADTKLSESIEPSANAFYNSLKASLAMRGYDKKDIQLHTPVLVYTMYDGYYIYSPYTNVAKIDISNQEVDINVESENIDYGFKPYVYYSCRYKPNNQSDFVITYSLDNYISIVGIINNTYVNKAGYLLDKSTLKKNGDTYKYNGIEIVAEGALTEQLLDSSNPQNTKEYKYIKINGTKYYWDEENEEIFFISNGSRQLQIKSNSEKYSDYVEVITNNRAGYLYYKEAYEFTEWLLANSVLRKLKASDAVDATGNKMDLSEGNYTFIFNDSTLPMEYPSSNFNQQRKAVIRYSIESNLSISIANFNKYSSSSNEFQMPKLKETDWEMLENQVSIISFLQGFSIGGKIYNGYTVITNDKTEEVVKEEDIYIIAEDGYYHKINDKHFDSNSLQNGIGVLDLDFEVRRDLETQLYYFPKIQLGCYTSIVSQDNVNYEYDSIYEYLENSNATDNIKRVYYTALGRERWGQYRVTDKNEFSVKLEKLISE